MAFRVDHGDNVVLEAAVSEARIKLRVRGVERSWEIPGLTLEVARDVARELILARYHVETLLDEDDAQEDEEEPEGVSHAG